jgi:hypothetical protein
MIVVQITNGKYCKSEPKWFGEKIQEKTDEDIYVVKNIIFLKGG